MYDGVIDEVSLYSRALTAIEATASASSASPHRSGLVNWWTGDSDVNDILDVNNSTNANAITFVPAEVTSGFKMGPAASSLFNNTQAT
jgi:hypothetical protein